MNPITMPNLLRGIPDLVGDRPDPRWTRASLTLRGSDQESRETFFARPVEERVGLIHDRVVTRRVWAPLLQVDVPKRSGGTRPICWATVVDTALLYGLTDALAPYVEAQLTDVAVAYRPHRPVDRSIRHAIQTMRQRDLLSVCVIDVSSFFDSIPWRRLDAIIDQVPADPDVRVLLKQLVRVEVRRQNGERVERRSGIPQGLQISPLMANLVLAGFDRRVQKTLSRRGCVVRRYADDILVVGPNLETVERARDLVAAQLRWETLSIKEGTGECLDLREPGVRARWLGIELSTVDVGGGRGLVLAVPETTVAAKAQELASELDAGVISRNEVEVRLSGLERFYGAILSEKKTAEIVHSIRERTLRISTPARLQTDMGTRSIPDPQERKVTKTIKNLIHPTRSFKTNTRDPRDSGLDDAVGWGPSSSLSLRSEAGRVRVRSYGSFSSLSRAGRCPGREGSDSDDTVEVPSADVGGSRSVDRQVDGLLLPAPGGLSPFVPARLTGAPACSRSGGRREIEGALVRAEARGSRRVHVRVSGASSWEEELAVPKSRSGAEAVIAGFEHAVDRLVDDGVVNIMLTTRDPTIVGYVEHGWRVRSLRVLSGLRVLESRSAETSIRVLGRPSLVPV